MKMKVCRLCMRDSYPGMSNIYQPDPHNNTVTTATRIMWVTHLQVSEQDGLPCEICAQCLIQLNAAYFFIEQCMNTDKALRSATVASQPYVPSQQMNFSPPATLPPVLLPPPPLPAPALTSPTPRRASLSEDGERLEDFNSPGSEHDSDPNPVQVKVELEDCDDPCENICENSGSWGEQTGNSRAHQYYYSDTSTIKSEPVKSWAENNGSNGVIPITFTCSICDGSFKNKQSYISHIRLHTSEQMQFECGECKKTFNCQSHLNRHLRSHSGENPYKCPVCAKAFYRQDHLTKHFRCHTGERPYHCPNCPRSFARQDHLSNHVKLHAKPRPFNCNICNKSFFKESGLIKHSKCHPPVGLGLQMQSLETCAASNIVSNFQVTEN